VGGKNQLVMSVSNSSPRYVSQWYSDSLVTAESNINETTVTVYPFL